MIVTGNDLVEYGKGRQAGVVGVVVHHIHHHLQARLIEGLHHLPQFDNACCPIGIGRITAFGRVEMEGVVPPVEPVVCGHPVGDARCIIGFLDVSGCRIIFGKAFKNVPYRGVAVDFALFPERTMVNEVADTLVGIIEVDPVFGVFIYGCDIINRKQVQMGKPGIGQADQMGHTIRQCRAVTAVVGHGQIGAAVFPGNSLVEYAEIPHMGLIQGDVDRARLRFPDPVPASGFKASVAVQISKLAEPAVG